MQGTSHTKMRTATARLTDDGCVVRRRRPARGADERRHIAESLGVRL